MADLIRDLDEVVRLSYPKAAKEKDILAMANLLLNTRPDASSADVMRKAASLLRDLAVERTAAVNYIRQHHAAIRRDAEDAAFGRAIRDAMEAEYQAAKESRRDGKQEAWITTYCLLRRLKVAAEHLSDAAIAKENGRG